MRTGILSPRKTNPLFPSLDGPCLFSFWAGGTSNSWNGSLRFFALLIRSLFSMHPDTSTSLLRSHRLSFPALTEEKASSATPESIEPGTQGPSQRPPTPRSSSLPALTPRPAYPILT